MKIIYTLFLFLLSNLSFASTIILHKHNAEVWSPNQIIIGEIEGFTTGSVTVFFNESSFIAEVNNREFLFDIKLLTFYNKIWVEAHDGLSLVVSDTLFLTLGYNPTPIVKPFATVDGSNAIILDADIVENPYEIPLRFFWFADDENPASVSVENDEEALTKINIPDIPGKYFFNLLVIAEDDSVWFQTLLVREPEKVQAFDIDSAPPTWMNDAVIYEITPYNFVPNGKFNDITAKLPELQSLGINTIWLQPVFRSSYRGQGYDVVDYFSINPALGTEKELQELINTAKDLDMRVLFDLVLNHTSIQHPYARDRVAHGEKSHYYDYYQTTNDGAPYSMHYNRDENGFMFYFWEDLVNLNYHNEEVQRWMLEVCKHWVKKYDIDGYRFDAIWGVNARNPDFASRLRTEIKSLKPDLLMLAEDKGTDPEVYALGYDAAFDWTTSRSWVSQWSWEYEFSETESKTIFNHPNASRRGSLLRGALFQNKDIAYRKLRFLENNDLHRFIESHDLERTKMAAALVFGVPGIPMLYNGQEIGYRLHPYVTPSIFSRNASIENLDQEGLFPYYQNLIRLKKEYPALRDTTFNDLTVAPGEAMVAFHRWKDEENFVVIINMENSTSEATIELSGVIPPGQEPEEFGFEDVLSGDLFNLSPDHSLRLDMVPYSVRWLLLKGREEITGIEEAEIFKYFKIFPNPSDGNLTIHVPGQDVYELKVIDMLGRTIFEEKNLLSNNEISLNIKLPSNTYFIQLRNGKEILTSKILIK